MRLPGTRVFETTVSSYAVLAATFIAGIIFGSLVLRYPRQIADHNLQIIAAATQNIANINDPPPPCSNAPITSAPNNGEDGGMENVLGGEQMNSTTTRKSKLADGCWAVYLDVGSNIGVQVRKLFEGEKYPKARVLPYFARHFGTPSERRQPGRVCAFGFEANPARVERLRALETCYNSLGWRVHFIAPRAVLNSDEETIQFHLDRAELNQGQNLAASMFVNRWTKKVSDVRTVTTMHLGKFIMEEIAGRLIPEGYTEPGPVFAKIDIEGAEYQTFGGLITSGALCEVQEASVEFHPSFIPPDKQETFFALQKMVESLADMSKSHTGCKTMKMNALDDESYLTDGMSPPEQCTPF